MIQSLAARDKLQAVLNCVQRNVDGSLPPIYAEACATWFAGLTHREKKVAALAVNAYRSGDHVSAEEIARNLPLAPIPPDVVRKSFLRKS